MILRNGALKIIDRRKNIFKLSQGEYVAPEKVENVYVQVSSIAEAFVYGMSTKNYLIGIFVPEVEVFNDLAQELGQTGTFEELLTNDKMKDHVYA